MVLVFSYLAKFLGSLDSQYETLFGSNESSNEMSGNRNNRYRKRNFLFFSIFIKLDIRELSQKITRYLKTSQRTLSLPVGEVMLNRKGKLYVLYISSFFH